MKYYLVIIQKTIDDIYPTSIFAYDTKEQALSAYHSNLASMHVNDNLADFYVQVMDGKGSVFYSEAKDL